MFQEKRNRTTHTARLRMEQLEDRALPSGMTGTLQQDFTAVKSDVQTLANSLAANTSSAVRADLQALGNNLNALSGDISAGRNAALNLARLTTSLTSLDNTLGSNIGTAISGNMSNLSQALRTLAGDVVAPGPGRGDLAAVTLTQDIRSLLTQIQSQAQTIASGLASNTSTAVRTDLATIKNDLTALAGNITGGTSPTVNLNKLLTDLSTLHNDLGTGFGRTMNQAIISLRNDLMRLNRFVTALTGDLNTDVRRLESDITRLTNQIKNSATGTVRTDLNTLDTALMTLASDFGAGMSITSDLRAVIGAETNLNRDLSGTFSVGAQGTLFRLAFDLAAFTAANA